MTQLGDVTFDHQKLEKSFFEQGIKVTLKGIHATHTLKTINRLKIVHKDHLKDVQIIQYMKNNNNFSYENIQRELLVPRNNLNSHATWKSNSVGFYECLMNMFSSLGSLHSLAYIK